LIILFVLVFSTITILFIWFVQSSSITLRQHTTQSLHRDLAIHMIEDNQLLRDGKIDPKVLKHTFHSMMLLGPAFEIYVTDTTGNILAFSAPPDKVKRKRIDVTPVKAFITNRATLPLLGEDPRDLMRHKIFSAAPLYQEEALQGYLYVIIGSQLEDNILATLIEQRLISQHQALLIAVILFAVLIGAILIRYIVKPIAHITGAVSKYERSAVWQQGQSIGLTKLQSQWFPSNEELLLADAIDQMSVTMASQYEEIAYKDEQRKELLSYISHDLRTPLSSLIGYIETWQRQTCNKQAPASSDYLTIALKNAYVLNDLVEQVFDLAHLETGAVELRREPLAIAELAQDIIETFKLQAQSGNVTLDFTPKDSTIWVDADIAKLERVFSNLVANAIRHTPSGGNILMTFSPIVVNNEQRVLIRVSDSGSGIPPEQLPRVFEAHFRAANRRDSESGNAGLGLAIVKALLDLHQTSIVVTSEENCGTCFEFSLPRYQR